MLEEKQYSLRCNYGIGKPNTNGFIKGGRHIVLAGTVKKENNRYRLQHGEQVLLLAALNPDLLHILGPGQRLLVGNGGWSYTLNSLSPAVSASLNLQPSSSVFPDSMVLEGRTPCGVPGVLETGRQCYKLKWLIHLYADAGNKLAGSYSLKGTAWRTDGGIRGRWQLIKEPDGRIFYHLLDAKKRPFIHLLKLDEGVVIFTDDRGRLLVGDLDFSYTLNRRF